MRDEMVEKTKFLTDCCHQSATFSAGTMYSCQEYMFSIPVQDPLLEADDIHLLILQSKLTCVCILQQARSIHVNQQGLIFVSHPLLTVSYLLWEGTHTMELHYQAC